MKRRLNGSIQGKRAMHKARQRAKFKREIRNSNYNKAIEDIIAVTIAMMIMIFVCSVLMN
jgi:hypothetical protein